MSALTYNGVLIRTGGNDLSVTSSTDVPEPIQETKSVSYKKVSEAFDNGSTIPSYKYIHSLQTYVPDKDMILTSYGICDGHSSQTVEPLQGGYVFVSDDPNNYSNGKMRLLITPSQVELTNAGTDQKLGTAYYHLYTLKKPIVLNKGKMYFFPAVGNQNKQSSASPSEENIITYSSTSIKRKRICYCSNKEVINPAKLAMRYSNGTWVVNDTVYDKFKKGDSGPPVLQFNGTSMDDGTFV